MTKLTNTLSVLFLALLLSACSDKSFIESDMGLSDAPDWVNEGTQAVSDDDGRLIHGVGMAPAMGDVSLQKATADNRARADNKRPVRVMEPALLLLAFRNGSRFAWDSVARLTSC